MEFENNSNKSEDHLFYYEIEEAVKVVWNNISEQMQQKYSYEEVFKILKIEECFFDEMGINIPENKPAPFCDYPVDIDWDLLKYNIIHKASSQNIYLSFDDLDELLDAELLYYKINDALSDAGDYLN